MYKFNEVAQYILESDYLLENETPEQMFMRTSKKIASIEKTKKDREYWTERFYNTIQEGSWIPATPFLMNSDVNNMLSSCFVVGGVNDDLHSIFQANERSAIITKMGGGLGLSISKLREKGATIVSTKGESTGAISFMKVFNTTLDVVMQARRRGAGIIVNTIYHPDIEDFITVKSDHGEITNFNISVVIDDDFMIAVKNNQDIELKSPLGYVTKKISAKKLFDKLCDNAHKHAEPGIVFVSAINKDNPTLKNLGPIDKVNACGEIPLYDNEACNLASINLQMIIDENGEVDYEKLTYITQTIVRFLDNSIDINNFPDELIKEAVMKTRKLGIGVMGLHTMLIKAGLEYDSEEGRKFARNVLKFITDNAQLYSCELINEGRELPSAWYGSTFEENGIKIRNLSVTAGQPTGATQLIMDEICSTSGVECLIAVVFTRNVRGTKYVMVNSLFRDIGYNEGWLNETLINKILDNNGSCQGINEVPEKWQKLFKTSLEISWEGHVRMQGALQEVTTNALSKTINMSQNSTVEDVYKAFMMAWELGCKGTTVYVQNSRDNQVLSVENIKEETKQYVPINDTLEIANSVRLKVKTGCGSMWLFLIYNEDGKLCEVFSQSGSSGGCQGMTIALTRMISTMLKANVDPYVIIEQLQSVKCDVSVAAHKKDKEVGKSCGDGIAKQMIKFLNGELKPSKDMIIQTVKPLQIESNQNEKFKCPECGEYTLTKYDGCVQCTKCTYQKCH